MKNEKASGGGQVTGLVTVSDTSPGSSFRELDHVFLQTQAKIWLGEVLHVRFDEETSMADLIADGELLFQVSKILWKMLVKKYKDLKYSKLHIYERTSSGKSDGKYMAYPKVDSFLKICQILGLTGIDLFSPSDVVERRDTRRVCMCIRSLSIKARSKNLNVPDFDVVTSTIAMPKYMVGGICRSFLDQSRRSPSHSSISSRGSYRQRSFSGNSEQSQELHYESDEAESGLTEVDFNTSISHAQLDQFHSSDIVGELFNESVNDTRFSLSMNSPGFSADDMDGSTSSMQIHYENSAAVVSGVNNMLLNGDNWLNFGKDGDLTPESKFPTSDKVRENSEDSGNGISDAESNCTFTVQAGLDDKSDSEKGDDNFTRELRTNVNGPFSDCTEESMLMREEGVPDLYSKDISSHFEDNFDSLKFTLSRSSSTRSIYENNLDSIGYVDLSSEKNSFSREIEAEDELECKKVLKPAEAAGGAPVELGERENKPKEGKHTGYKMITSFAGGITVVGVLLIFLQLRQRSNERNNLIILQSKIDKTRTKEATVERNVEKPNAVYPGEWLKI